jgi:hypothetical protein
VYDDGNNTDAGSHPFTVYITEAGYAGETRGTFVITPAPLLIQANDQLRAYYLLPDVTPAEFIYYSLTFGAGVPISSPIYTTTGLYPRDAVAGVTLTIEPSANQILTLVTTQNVTWDGAVVTLIPGVPNNPYIDALVIRDAFGTGLDNYDISYGVAANLSVVPTVSDMPVFTVASKYDTTIALSWTPPIYTDGGIPMTAMRFFLYNADLSGSGLPNVYFSEEAQNWYQQRDVSVSELGGLYTVIFEDTLLSGYTFQICQVNAVGAGIFTNLEFSNGKLNTMEIISNPISNLYDNN